MAEFTEVMRQAKRMCSSFGNECGRFGSECSDKCPLTGAIKVDADHYGVLCIFVGGGDVKRYKEIEARVMRWANDHPEPVYPSWEDGWKQLFPEAENVPCPDDIAEKLGIKPKEAK